MTLAAGTAITLNAVSYQIASYLGSGAITDVYAAAPANGSTLVALRLLRHDLAANSPQSAALRAEADVLARLNRLEDGAWPQGGPHERLARAAATERQRTIVALLDAGLDVAGRPFTVQELAPPALVPFPVASLADERRVLLVMAALVRAMALCHINGLSLKDFEPQAGKLNRVRVAWAPGGAEPDHLKLIDWNATGGPESQAQDRFWLGGHFYHLLFADHVPLNGGQPPTDLSVGNRRWEQVSVGSRLMLRRLLHPNPQRRPQSLGELGEDLAWWLEVAALADPDELVQRAWLLASDPERQLALADLAARRFPQRASLYAPLAEQARAKLGEARRLLLDPGLVSLRRGDYRRAEQEFDRLLADKTLDAELVREARRERGRARIAQQLQHGGTADPAESAAWRSLDAALEALRAREWPAANAHLSAVAVQLGPQPDASLHELAGLARGHLLAGEIEALTGDGLRSPATAQTPNADPDALPAAQARLAELGRLADELGQDEPELRDLLTAATLRVGQLEAAHAQVAELAALLRRSEDVYSAATTEWDVGRRLELHRQAEPELERLSERLRAQTPARPADELLVTVLDRLERVRAERQLLEQRLSDEDRARQLAADAALLLQQQRPGEAHALAQQAVELAGYLDRVRAVMALADTAWKRWTQAEELQARLKGQLEQGRWADAAESAQLLLAQDGQTIPLPEPAPDGAPLAPVRFLLPDRALAQRLLALAEAGKAADDALAEHWARGDLAAVLTQLEQLERGSGAAQIGLPPTYVDQKAQALAATQQRAADQAWLDAQLAAPRVADDAAARLDTLAERYAAAQAPDGPALRDRLARLACRLSSEAAEPAAAAASLRYALMVLPDVAPATRARLSQLCYRIALVVADLDAAIDWLDRAQMAASAENARAPLLAERRVLALAREVDQLLQPGATEAFGAGPEAFLQTLGWLGEAHAQLAPVAERFYAVGQALPRWGELVRAQAASRIAQSSERALAASGGQAAAERELIRATQARLVPAWQPELSPELRRRVADLLAAEDRARELERALDDTLARLGRGELSPRAGADTLQALAEAHTPPPQPRLVAAQLLLAEAARYDAPATASPVNPRALDELWQAAAAVGRLNGELAALSGSPTTALHPLQLRLEQLAFEREAHACAALEALCRSLSMGTPDAEAVDRLAELAATTRWIAAQPRQSARQAQAAQVRVAALLEQLAQQARSSLEQASGRPDLEAARLAARALNSFGGRLAAPVPPQLLPPGEELGVGPAFAALATLEGFAAATDLLAEYGRPEPRSGEPVGVLRRLDTLRRTLGELREQLWGELYRRPWPQDRALGDLDRVAEALHALCADLVLLDAPEPAIPIGASVERLAQIEARQEAAVNQTEHWLLGEDARAILAQIGAARRRLEGLLNERIDAALSAPYPQAVARLRDELLRPALSPRAAEQVTAAVVARVEARAAALPAHGLSPQARSGSAEYFWQIVAQASEPAAGASPRAGAPAVNALYRLASQRRAELGPAPQSPTTAPGQAVAWGAGPAIQAAQRVVTAAHPADAPAPAPTTAVTPWLDPARFPLLIRLGIALALIFLGAFCGWGGASLAQSRAVGELRAEVELLSGELVQVEQALEQLTRELRAAEPQPEGEPQPEVIP